MDTTTTSSTAGYLSRRALLGGIPIAGMFILAACSTDSGGSGTPSATTDPTGAPAAAGSVAALAQAFQATLSSDLQATLVQEYTLANAELWSNLPQGLLSGMGGAGGGGGGRPSGMPTDMPAGGTGGLPAGGMGGSAGPRLGISLGDLDDTQLDSFNTLLAAATGSGTGTGYDEIQQHLAADDYLGDNGGGDTYGRANFYVAFVGTPAETGTWEFQFGGHHLAVANTYIDGALVGATPSFRGIEPNGTFTQNGTTGQPMAVKEAAFTALLAGLSSDQLAAAKLSAVYSDLVLTPGNDWAFPTASEGVQVSTLSADQKQLVLAAIAGYVNDIADADAKTILARYEGELDATYVTFSGTTTLTERNDYIRIDGPSVWIEFSMQAGIVLDGNHPHSVWRDRTTDYGGTQS